MITFAFLGGMGAGALIVILLLLRVMPRVSRNYSKLAQKQHDDLMDLHIKRNKSIEVIAEWCLQRWQP